MNSVSWASFAKDEFTVATRDYLTVKVWDLRKTEECTSKAKIYDFSNYKLQSMYENECIFDRFDVKISADNKNILTGGYNNQFHVIDIMNGKKQSLMVNFD